MRRSQQERLIKSINAIQVSGDKDYGWLWEYSKFRFSHSISGVKAAEDKATSLLKFTLSLAGVIWLAFTYFMRAGQQTQIAVTPSWLIAGALLLGAFICAVIALVPSKRLRPFREEVAMRFISENEKDSPKPLGRFALGLMLCSDYSEGEIKRTSSLVLAGTVFLMLAISLFIFGAFSYPIRLPSSDHRDQIGYLAAPVGRVPVRVGVAVDPADYHLDRLPLRTSMQLISQMSIREP
jgi:hypothetical protein